ncbi:MAG: hypothetical protein RBU21_16970 [FCB group bacterium]|nr:hypothetical protein [FCB group bacterium]
MAGFGALMHLTWKQRVVHIAAITLGAFLFVALLTGGRWEKGCFGALGAFVGVTTVHITAGLRRKGELP